MKVGGYAMINIKNISKKEPCYDDFINIFNLIQGFDSFLYFFGFFDIANRYFKIAENSDLE